MSSHGAADFLAAVLLTFFHSVADPLALEVVDRIYFFVCHHFISQLVGIVNLVARELLLRFVADASFVHKLLAEHAIAIMTLHSALVAAARQKALTKGVTYRNWLYAILALPSEQTLNGLVA